MDAELNKADEAAKAAPAAAQEKKSSKPAVSDTVETAGLCLICFAVIFTHVCMYEHACACK